MLLTPGEAWWDVHGSSELSLGNIEGSISRDDIVEGLEDGDGGITVAGATQSRSLSPLIS